MTLTKKDRTALQRANARRDEYNAVIVQARRNGATYAEIASAVGLSEPGVIKIIKREAPDLASMDLRQSPADRDARIVAARREGMSAIKIGEAEGLTREGVRKVLEREAPELLNLRDRHDNTDN